MNSRLLGLFLLVSLVLANSNLIPIQLGVPNTISFSCSPFDGASSSFSGLSSSSSASSSTSSADLVSLISTLTRALGATTPVNNNPSGYTYSFSGLPSWVTSVNGPIITGTPPSSGTGTYNIRITITAANGASTTQNVVLAVPGTSGSTGSFGTVGGAFGSSSLSGSLGDVLQINNIYNPLNPGSPYNPYNPYNPNSANFGGSAGNYAGYFNGA